MKRYSSALLCLMLLLVCTPFSLAAERLSDYQWQNRLLLVRAAGNEQSIRAALDANRDAIIERDLVWFLVGSEGIEGSDAKPVPRALGEDILRILGASDAVVLIGKDGLVKGRYPKLDLQAVFSRIDSMPMRKREMSGN